MPQCMCSRWDFKCCEIEKLCLRHCELSELFNAGQNIVDFPGGDDDTILAGFHGFM